MTFLIIAYSVLATIFFLSGVINYTSKAAHVQIGYAEIRREEYGFPTRTVQVPIDKEDALGYMKTSRICAILSPIWPVFLAYLVLRPLSGSRRTEKELHADVLKETYAKVMKEYDDERFKDV